MKRLFLLFLLLFTVTIQAQEEATPTPTAPPPVLNEAIRAEFEVDNTAPVLGEPFHVMLIVEADSTIEILSWASFEPPLEVLEESEIAIETVGDRVRYSRNYRVVLWDVGDYLSGEILLSYRQGVTVSSVTVSSFFVQVPIQIDNPEEASLRPPAPVVQIPYIPVSYYIGVAIAIVILVLIVARLIQLSRKGVIEIVRASPAEKAIAVLEDLKEQNLPASTVYELVANNLREYLRDRYDIDAVEMTTAELMAILRERDIFPQEHRNRLQRVLEQADLVKFARFQPDDTNSVRLVNFAIKWLRETERIQ